jgi:hypothetical protein
LHFATDAWTSPNHKALIVVTVHFKQQGVPVSFLLDIVEVARSHSGANLAHAFTAVLDDFGIANKVSSHPIIHQNNSPLSKQILSITCDNVSANDAMIAHLAEKLNAFPGKPNRTRCFAHILNLVAKCVMKQFDTPKKKKKATNGEDVEMALDGLDDLSVESNGDGNDGEEPEEELDGKDDDGEEVPDGREGMSAAEIQVLDESVKPVRHVLTKVSHHPIIDDKLITL